MNKRRREIDKKRGRSVYEVQEGDRGRRIKSHRAQRPKRVEGPEILLTGERTRSIVSKYDLQN